MHLLALVSIFFHAIPYNVFEYCTEGGYALPPAVRMKLWLKLKFFISMLLLYIYFIPMLNLTSSPGQCEQQSWNIGAEMFSIHRVANLFIFTL